MIAEVLLLLSGHESSLFVPSTSTSGPSTLIASPHLTEYLHPGEITSLNALAGLAWKYRSIKSWATDVQRKGREAILSESLSSTKWKGKQREIPTSNTNNGTPNVYLTTLANSMINCLGEYEVSIVETESKILSFESTLVQDDQGYVPLSSLVATFDKWQIPLTSLSSLIEEISSSPSTSICTSKSTSKEVIRRSPAQLINLLEDKQQTGNPFLQKIYTKILSSLNQLFLTHLISFLLYGIAPSESTPTNPCLALDVGADPLSPKHRIYKLNTDLLPSSINAKTRESILYIGRVAATLKREGRSLPKTLVEGVREEVMGVKALDEFSGLDQAILRARAEVGEWLWRHILTGPQIIESIESLSNYFLTRKADLSLSFLRELDRLKLDKLILSNPHSSSSVIREQDLDLALLRASVGTSAEHDRSIENLKFKLERGPLRALVPSSTHSTRHPQSDLEGKKSHVYRLFSSALLGTPISMITSLTWPLDLFLSPKSISIYSDINSYLLSIRDTHLKMTDTWSSLSNSQRRRRKWTGNNEGGSLDNEIQSRKQLIRSSWGLIRLMTWFINSLLGHFMDIIEVQHRHLLKQIDIDEGTKEGLTSSTRGSLRGSINTKGSTPATRRGTSSNKDEGLNLPHSPLSESHTHTQTVWEERTNKSNKAPPTPTKQNNYLDFLTLRQIHSRHLTFLLEALLLSDPSIAALVRDILETCKRFTGLVERWGGDVLPSLLEESGSSEMIHERTSLIGEVNEKLQELILDFFSALLDSQNPPSSSIDPDKSSTEGKSFSRTARVNQISRLISRTSFSGAGSLGNKSTTKAGERNGEADFGMERHVEHLLLRLDFNGVLTLWREKDLEGEDTGLGSVLPQRGV
ncbi:uncharacterized protein IL334_006536 [Kwoniella shivajii]|uniref:Spindle pole body component n=1 Tax=Kwoniella shivajii TaxID=564305 RepID=A0ABZ1D689_9TREE|nr:hypothetical protein IL334_006536 [Kwoniella shivajii]